MRGFLSLLVLSAASGSCSGPAKPTPKTPLSAKDIVKSSSPAIVRVETGDGLGTGFISDKSGLVVTNLHVVRGKKEIRIKLYGGDVYSVMQVAGFDRGRDLALLRIQPTKSLPSLRLGDSDAMVPGDQIVAIGNPLGVFDYSVSSGLVSQVRPVCTVAQVALHNKHVARFDELLAKLRRAEASRDASAALTQQEEAELTELGCLQELTYFQISAPISQGSSGGPLFNQAGEVVGITTAIIAAGQNINLAIPGNYLKPIVARPDAISMDEFAKTTAEVGEALADDIKIDRRVPKHPLAVLDGCNRDQITESVKSIDDAIKIGAPLYNAGNHEACYRIYEGTATKYERDAPCQGVKTAFGDGLLRASSMESFKQKAWAMRDTFDGLIGVAEKWAMTNNTTPPPKPKLKPPKQ